MDAADAVRMHGVLTGIDPRKVVSSGLLPVINTAIANKLPGRGQIGAGVVTPPMACFEEPPVVNSANEWSALSTSRAR